MSASSVVRSPSDHTEQKPRHLRSANFAGDPVLESTLNNLFTLKKGSAGAGVERATRLVQEGLLQLGYSLPKFGADGKFGNETMTAVSAFQYDHALATDGKVGPDTLGALDDKLASPAPSGPEPIIPGSPNCIVLTGNESAEFLNQLKNRGFVIRRSSTDANDADAGDDSLSVDSGGRVLACKEHFSFGHGKGCDQATLSGKVWPGHAKAAEFVDAGIRALMDRSTDPDVQDHFRSFFSNAAASPANFKEILDRFLVLRAALDDEFLYECRQKGEMMGHRCGVGLFAHTEESEPNNIELCVPSIAPYTVAGMGALIVHEQVHRLGFRGERTAHVTQFRDLSTGECPDKGALYGSPPELSKNSDSFACFGAWAKKSGH